MIKECKVCGQRKEHKSWNSTTCNDCLETGIKLCSQCGEIKPLTEFRKSGRAICSYCRPCECKVSKRSKAESGYYNRPEVREKRNAASRESKRKEFADPVRHMASNDRRNKRLRERRCIDNEYRLLVNENNRINRHARLGDFTAEDWHTACEAFGYRCAYCGAETKLTMDHVVPVTMGGKTCIDNIIPACASCNSSKSNNDMVEWFTAKPFYKKERLEDIIKYLQSKKGDDA